VLEHSLRVLGSPQRVSLLSLDRPTHGTDSLLNVCVDQLVDLRHVRRQLLDIVLFFGELEEK